jgi:hypothetical protein
MAGGGGEGRRGGDRVAFGRRAAASVVTGERGSVVRLRE